MSDTQSDKSAELYTQLERAVKLRDIELVEELTKSIKNYVVSRDNKVKFVHNIEILATGNPNILMFDTGVQAEAVYSFLDVMAEHGYSIYDDDGNEVLVQGKWE